MYKSLSSIREFLVRATRRSQNSAVSASFHKTWRSFRDAQHPKPTFQEPPNPSSIGSIGHALVGAIAPTMAAERVILFLPQANQDKLVIAASEGVDDSHSMSLQARSPFLIWLQEQHRVVAAEEIYPLPQWHGTPPGEQEALTALGCQLFVAIRTGSASNGLLVIGPRKGGNAYSREEIEGLELLVHQAATDMEMAHLHHQLYIQQQELHQVRRQMASSTGITATEGAISALAREIEGSLQNVSALVHEMDQQADEQNASRQTIDALRAEIAHARDALLPLLDLIQERQSSRSIHSLNSLLSSVVSASGLGTRGSKIKLTLQLDPGEPNILCDGEQIRQVFLNLITNALDAMSNEGVLDISTTLIEDRVEIKFSDTGVGISAEQIERVFDTFFTTKPEESGSGVGLASSRRTVERHQGTITMNSRVGKGTTVTIVFPVQPALEG
jgi:signal transduction histidine kinase